MELVELIASVRSGVVQIVAERNRQRIGSGSAFLVKGGLVTNNHNLRSASFDALAIRFPDTDPEDPTNYIRIIPDDCVAIESQENEKDYAYLRVSGPEFKGRHLFEFSTDASPLSAGEQVLFLGFPFGMPQLTCHVGHVSSIHDRNGIEIIQIDGSVNGGNSGGPLLDLKTGMVAGIVTRAVTGIIENEFKNLIAALRQNQEVCKKMPSIMKVGGVDPIQAIGASQAAMEQIARNLFRSANVGIGYAYSSVYVRDAIARLENE